MCGIVFKYNKDGSPVNNNIMQQFDKQRNRGVQGFGLFSYKDNKSVVVRNAEEDGILEWLVTKESPLIMFHHRFPTSTINVAQAAHPMTTHKYFGKTQYVLIHNGVIYNDDKMFVKHQELGIEYKTLLKDLTFNDSESLLWEFALTMEGKQPKMEIQGDLAFVCAKLVEGKLETIYFGKNGRPLKLFFNKKTLELSSEGKGNDIATNRLYSYDYKTNKLSKKNMTFTEPRVYTYLPSVCRTTYPSKWYPSVDNDPNYYYSDDDDEYDELSPPRYTRDSDGIWREHAEKTPNQLEAILRARFPRLFDIDPSTPISTILSEDTLNEIDYDMLDTDVLNVMEPSYDQVQAKCLEALNICNGSFNSAYWILEGEYSDVLEKPETINNLHETLLLEACMEFLEKDPDNINEQSISSLWRTLCKPQLAL